MDTTQSNSLPSHKKKIGLCLSGGGARGAFHIGVLQALDEFNIVPTLVSGTSAGALTGSLYCAGVKPAELLKISTSTKWYHFIGPHVPNNGLVDFKFLQQLLNKYIPHNSFEKLKIPFIATATNLQTGFLEYFSSGPIYEPVIASCAVPIVFKPVIINGMKYLDGGITMNLPAQILRQDCDYIIGSNLIPHNSLKAEVLNSYNSILTRVLEINLFNNIKQQLPFVDLLIESEAISEFSRFDLNNAEKLFKLGHKTALEKLEFVFNSNIYI
ncbi:MAG: patatin-like phospholipase family protein [Saprospiraceae bacterium]|nr:patatin-like phospholipase family protein [Saprospiraceae bacterium]